MGKISFNLAELQGRFEFEQANLPKQRHTPSHSLRHPARKEGHFDSALKLTVPFRLL